LAATNVRPFSSLKSEKSQGRLSWWL